jgi:hypothetical protein
MLRVVHGRNKYEQDVRESSVDEEPLSLPRFSGRVPSWVRIRRSRGLDRGLRESTGVGDQRGAVRMRW